MKKKKKFSRATVQSPCVAGAERIGAAKETIAREPLSKNETLSHADAMIEVAAEALAGTFRRPRKKYLQP